MRYEDRLKMRDDEGRLLFECLDVSPVMDQALKFDEYRDWLGDAGWTGDAKLDVPITQDSIGKGRENLGEEQRGGVGRW